MSQTLREQAERAIQTGNVHAAVQALAALWHADPGPATAGFILSRYERLQGPAMPHSARVAILRSFTVEPIIPLLRAGAVAQGINLTVHAGDFNAYAQELLSPDSGVYAFAPTVAILAVETRAIAPELWPGAGEFSPDASEAVAERVIEQMRGLIAAFRDHSQATLIVHNLEAPDLAGAGVLDVQSACGQLASIARINAGLRTIAASHRGVYVLDYDSLVARHGRQQWRDEKRWLTARLPIRGEHLIKLAGEWLRYLVPISGRIAKVVAVDLDNTLWGGVVGEDGMTGIRLDGEYPGAAYQAVQRALLDLRARGILLAIASKNNRDDAMEVIDQHPGMLLRSAHFSAFQINWHEKSENLREIARELNLGLDAIAFFDDNPVERQAVRESAPEVMVIEPGETPMDFARALREFTPFERLTLSQEDRQRGEYYAADRQRAELETTSPSREGFFWSLEQEAEIALVSAATEVRVAELTQKTNQFNLTTNRYTTQQIQDLASRDNCQVWSIRVKDRYGDNGLVGVAITRDHGQACEIDTFLLSCRVIGRTVETALLAHLSEQAHLRGRDRIEGWFRPTKKNAPAAEFYASHQFVRAEEAEGATRWVWDLGAGPIPSPPWVRVLRPQATGNSLVR